MLSVVMLNVVTMNVEAPFKMTVTEMTHFNLDCVTKCSRQRSDSHTSFLQYTLSFLVSYTVVENCKICSNDTVHRTIELANIHIFVRLSWNRLLNMNALAYLNHLQVTKKFSPLYGRLLPLLVNIRLGWNSLLRMNTLAYLIHP